MLQEIYSAVTNLPAVIQGAFGSALFAGVLWSGQRLLSVALERSTHFSKSRRKKYLLEEIAKLCIQIEDDNVKRTAFMALLIYRSLIRLFKALIWLSLGLVLSFFNPIFGTVGYLGALYYFFEGLNTVRAPAKSEDKKARILALKNELTELNKASKETG